MPYYHVQITTKTDGGIVELDVSAEELESRFLEPYRLGKPIVISGMTVTAPELERIQITETLDDSHAVNRDIRARDEANNTFGFVDTQGRLSSLILFEHGTDVTSRYITRPPGHAAEPQGQPTRQVRPAANAREVFVVHGRNLAARDALFEFLRSLDLHPLEWSEAVRATDRPSPYIGEILDAAFSRAHAVVVLFTPDDEAKLRQPYRTDSDPPHETVLTGQARPNVLFEAGMAIARDQDRTVLVELGDLRPFSDIAGRHTIRLNHSSQRRQELAQRLQAAGCPVNLDGTDWHSAGDFEAAIRMSNEAASEDTEGPSLHSNLLQPNRLSEYSITLLEEATKDKARAIIKVRTAAGLQVITNRIDFVERGNPRSEAKWENAIRELAGMGLVEDTKGLDEVFEVSHSGFELVDSLREE